MPESAFTVWLPLVALYALFLAWYRGSGKPLTREEIDYFVSELRKRASDELGMSELADVERFAQGDDGREFIMHNNIRYRSAAAYPPGYDFGPDARAADRRYGKAILPHLLRYGNLPVFIGTRSGSFVEPPGIDRWDVVAMVRYRSRRDFLRFALAITSHRITVHKWAAIENTQIFPVRPLVSLVFVRGAVGALLAVVGLVLAA